MELRGRFLVGKRSAALLGAALLALVAFSSLASAEGGSSIATATDLSNGGTIQGTTPDTGLVAWFTATVAAGDLLTIGWGPIGSAAAALAEGLGMCILPAGTDDFRAGQEKCIPEFYGDGPRATLGKLQYTLRVKESGKYPFVIVPRYYCMGNTGDFLRLPCRDSNTGYYANVPASYDFVIRVQVKVRATVRIVGPENVLHGKTVRYSVSLASRKPTTGAIALQVHQKGRWKTLAHASSVAGKALLQWTPPSPGLYGLRAYYPG